MDSLERIKYWKMLQGENYDENIFMGMVNSLFQEWQKYLENTTKYYFACGHDAGKKRYKDWCCSDIRDVDNIFKWDNLLGHPFADGQLEIVKSKLALGMFTYNQAKFIICETARVLKVGGQFEITYRDYDLLHLRRKELDHKMFNRYMNGNGLYFGSQRKSIWYKQGVLDLCKEFNLENTSCRECGMNITFHLKRVEGKLKKFSPEPKVKFDKEGAMVNDGGDFPGA
jgi:hypothetical protein